MNFENEFKRRVESLASTAGFVETGYINSENAVFSDWLSVWLSKGYHADMKWLENHQDIRKNPCQIVEEGKSIITFLYPYLTKIPKNWQGDPIISNYAQGKDYHKEIKRKLKRIKTTLQEEYPDFKGHYFVDSAPIPEKIVAAACGLGWIGKNSMLINRQYGSYVFIAEIVCNFDLTSSSPVPNRCGKCTKCLAACPSQAIIEPGVIDANRCISYLTIEKNGEFKKKESDLINYQLFGCDICQQVCPWNKKVKPLLDSEYTCFERWLDINPEVVLGWTEQDFEALKINSPLKRAGLEKLKRNARAILKNRSV